MRSDSTTSPTGLFRVQGILLLCLLMPFYGWGTEPSLTDTTPTKAVDLQEVIVRKKRQRYSKKNNPAVELLRRVRDAHSRTDASQADYYTYDSHTKTVLGLNDFNSKLPAKMEFLQTSIDTSSLSGKRVLVLSIKEKLASYEKSPENRIGKEKIVAYRTTGVDEAINQHNVQAVLEDVAAEVDIFSPSVKLMQNRFVGPVSKFGEDYYRYAIVDTVPVGGKQCVEISFAPHNPQSFSFNGSIFVAFASDSLPYVKRVTMRIPKRMNMNYVNNLYIHQNFSESQDGFVDKTDDDFAVELQILPHTPEAYARRTVRRSNFVHNPYDSLGRPSLFAIHGTANDYGDLFWDASRLIPLSHAEKSLPQALASMRRNTFFGWAEKALRILEEGYVKTHLPDSKFDFGPVNTLISHDTAEGVRFRIGGMTTAHLNRRLFGRGYVAYGLRDRKVKYEIEGEYSFSDKEYHSREFPRHAVSLLHRYDIDLLGQHYLFTNSDNIFLSLKRKDSYPAVYRRHSEAGYLKEWTNHLSISVTLKQDNLYPTRWVGFEDGNGKRLNALRTATCAVTVRYAPGEKFTQGRTNRAPINMDSPVFQLTHEYGPKGLLGSRYCVNKTELSYRQRFWFSSFGYADVLAGVSKIWSRVDFPSLLWPNANLSYTIQPESYSLMNPMEFANDEMASAEVTYFACGALFNRIPWFNRLHLREVFTFKCLAGHLTDRNNPAINADRLMFPTISNTRPMGKTPYMECGVGIDNILTVLRLDYVWRLTYRDLPGIDKSGMRVSLHFSF